MVKVYDYSAGSDTPMALCLGFFDCLHLGHTEIIGGAKEAGLKLGAEPALFTFDVSPAEFLNKRGEGEIFTLRERLYRMDELGIHSAVTVRCDEAFLSTPPEEFLSALTDRFNIRAIVCGADYTYGAKGAGNVGSLRAFCGKKDIFFKAYELKRDENGEKIASRKIREFVKNGDIRSVNRYLPLPYIIMGKVVHGRHDGRKIGFPTANVNLEKDKLKPKTGVYYTNVTLCGKKYPCITNVGDHPTFDDYSVNVETHIIGFDGDLYGRTITVEFMDKIRDIVKFNSKEEIAEQLRKDVMLAREKFEND